MSRKRKSNQISKLKEEKEEAPQQQVSAPWKKIKLELLQCPVCWEMFDDGHDAYHMLHLPMNLNCSHTICLECLWEIWHINTKNNDIHCAICRELIHNMTQNRLITSIIHESNDNNNNNNNENKEKKDKKDQKELALKLFQRAKFLQVVTHYTDISWITLIQFAAELGHTESQYQLAEEYHNKKQLTKARQWYQKAADAGCCHSQFMIAQYYSDINQGSPQLEKAFEYFKKSADNMNIQAMRRVGQMAHDAIFYPVDHPFRQYLRASYSNDIQLHELVIQYWVKMAETPYCSTYPLLACFLFELIHDQLPIIPKLNEEEKKKYTELWYKWASQAVTHYVDEKEQLQIAITLIEYDMERKEFSLAATWLDQIKIVTEIKEMLLMTEKKELAGRYYWAMSELRQKGYYYTSACFRDSDADHNIKAMFHLRLAANQGHLKACIKLAQFYELVAENLEQAQEYYYKAAKQNHKPSQEKSILLLFRLNQVDEATRLKHKWNIQLS